MTSETISAWSGVATAVLTAAGVVVAWVQLSGIKKSMNMGALMAVLEIETQMNERKVHFDECSANVRQAALDKQPEEALRIRADLFNSAKENYFNALDRLSFCILKDYLCDKDWRADYRNLLQITIGQYPGDFNEASPFRNIKNLNTKWQSE